MRKSDTIHYLPENRTELQRLQEYLTKGGDSSKLSPEWKQMWDTIKVVDAIIREYVSPKQQIEKMRQHDLLKHLSRTQLWRYRDAAQEIYGATEAGNKRYKRLIAEQLIQKGLDLAESLADGRLWAEMIKQYIKLHGLEDQNDDATNQLEPQANMLVVVLDGKPRTIDLNNPAAIDADLRASVLQAIYVDQTPATPNFIDDADYEELPAEDTDAE